MWGRLIALLCAISVLICALGCGTVENAPVSEDDIKGRTYLYEGKGAGSGFTITIEDDGTFSYYEGFLSSYIGYGDWRLVGDVLVLEDRSGYDIINRFIVKKDHLVFVSEGSKGFLYVDVSDGEKFNVSNSGGVVMKEESKGDTENER